jgi:hypothetical protein
MADRGGRRRLRLAAAWLLTAAIAVFALVDWGGDDDARIAATAGDGDGDPELRIRMLSDAEVSPGDAIVVRFDNADPALPLAARIGGETADILDRRPRSAVVRVPLDAPTGRAPLRLTQGSRKSKAWDLLVRPPRHRKLWPRIVGGLALFLYGFGVLASGLRGLAGRRLRAQLGRLTEAPLRATGLGVAIGAATQLTTTATAVTVGLIEARLLALAPALAIAVGALLGASLIGALLPLGFAKVSLEIIAVGVVWTTLADRRHARAVGHAVLGAGLVLYGLRLLQTGGRAAPGRSQAPALRRLPAGRRARAAGAGVPGRRDRRPDPAGPGAGLRPGPRPGPGVGRAQPVEPAGDPGRRQPGRGRSARR